MSLSDLRYLKELSWYTTVPLLVCAWIIQDQVFINPGAIDAFGFTKVVGEYFLKVVVGMFFAYIIWLAFSVYIDTQGLLLTLLLAAFLLTLAAVGVAIFLIDRNSLPANILWFIALGSIAFNIFQMHKGIMVREEGSSS